jgi:hypothetical protein
VRDRDQRGAFVVFHPAQERVPLETRGLLEPAFLAARTGAHRRAAAPEGNTERRAEGVTEGRVVGRVRAQAVVEMRGHQPEATAALERSEHVRQRD